MKNDKENQPILWKPQEGKQESFTRRFEDVVLFGGAKGGGKSDVLLFEGLRQIHHPRYKALILRRTFPQLQELIDRAQAIFPTLGAKWQGDTHRFVFPSGAIYKFGHCQHEEDKQNYNGHEYQYIAFDQLEQFTETQFSYICAQNRTSAPDLRCYIRASANPGGIGHNWVKRVFIDGKDDSKTYTQVFSLPGGGSVSKTFCFIKSTIYDNKILLKNNPQYLSTLMGLPEKMRKAFLEGDWDVFEGQFFAEWDNAIHVVKPFAIPEDWRKYRSIDWGFAKPLCCHWWAVAPDGRCFCYREYYVTRVSPSQAAQTIKKITDLAGERIYATFVDPSMSGVLPEDGKSLIERFQEEFGKHEIIVPADNDRVSGWSLFRDMLALQSNGLPRAQWFETCKNAISTIPSLIHDETNPEDVDTDGEDHAADCDRYFFISRFAHAGKKKDEFTIHIKTQDPVSIREWKNVEKMRRRMYGEQVEVIGKGFNDIG